MGFEKPTPVQDACIPSILEGRDVLVSAQTGTGKTAAFAIPVLEKLSQKKRDDKEGIRALIITPTRELAGQVDEVFFVTGYHTGLSTAKVYGGDDWARQEKALSRGTNIIVATPGRLIDHMKIHDVDFSNLDFLILDEADRMLDMGFIPDITHIVSRLPENRQTLLFSATLPSKIVQLAKSMMKNPERINLAPSNKAAEGVAQGMYYVEERDKLPLVLHLYEQEKWASAIIFTSTKRGADKLSRELTRKGASVTSIHGDRSQAEREKALESFRKGDYRIIVATDVMARGIDVIGVSHVINFSVPHDVEDYVHRVGRTARAEATGDAITLVSGQDRRYMENIIRVMKSNIKKLDVPAIGQNGRNAGSETTRQKDNKESSGAHAGERNRKQGDRNNGRIESKSRQKGRSNVQENQHQNRPDDQPGSTSNQEQKDAGAGVDNADSSSNQKRSRGRNRPGYRRSGRRPVEKQEPDAQNREKADVRGKGKTEARRKQGAGKESDEKKSGSGHGKSRKRSDVSGKSGGEKRQDNAPRKSGQRGVRPAFNKDAERNELFENITSPDMDRVNKSVEKKRGIWKKLKEVFGSD